MTKRLLFAFIISFTALLSANAQVFKGRYLNEDLKVKFDLNLYNDTIPVPGLDDETCYGYLQGNINGNWVVLKVISLEADKAVVRASCDNGSDSQNLELKVIDEKHLQIRQLQDANIKMIENNKYVKMPKTWQIHK